MSIFWEWFTKPELELTPLDNFIATIEIIIIFFILAYICVTIKDYFDKRK